MQLNVKASQICLELDNLSQNVKSNKIATKNSIKIDSSVYN